MKWLYQVDGELVFDKSNNLEGVETPCSASVYELIKSYTGCYDIEENGPEINFKLRRRISLPSIWKISLQEGVKDITLRYTIAFNYAYRSIQLFTIFVLFLTLPEKLAVEAVGQMMINVVFVTVVMFVFYISVRDFEINGLIRYLSQSYKLNDNRE